MGSHSQRQIHPARTSGPPRLLSLIFVVAAAAAGRAHSTTSAYFVISPSHAIIDRISHLRARLSFSLTTHTLARLRQRARPLRGGRSQPQTQSNESPPPRRMMAGRARVSLQSLIASCESYTEGRMRSWEGSRNFAFIFICSSLPDGASTGGSLGLMKTNWGTGSQSAQFIKAARARSLARSFQPC